MKVVKIKEAVRREVLVARSSGLGIGLVPTMGYFHEGHLSLIRKCRELAGFTVVSIFVNPTQFGPGEDFERYPRDLERDLALARGAGADLVFAPSVEQMYGADASTQVLEEAVSRGLCGAARPGHFRGVATVVVKLFNIVGPDTAVFGRKDLQQLAVIRRVVRDLDLPVQVIGAPTVREPDGLAMSSRNVYLTPAERERAPELQRALHDLAVNIAAHEGEITPLMNEARNRIESATGGRVDYLSAVDETMREVCRATDCRWLAAALFLGRTRLIDNVEVGPGGGGAVGGKRGFDG